MVSSAQMKHQPDHRKVIIKILLIYLLITAVSMLPFTDNVGDNKDDNRVYAAISVIFCGCIAR